MYNINVWSELSCRQPIWLLETIPIPRLLGSLSGRDIKFKASSKRRGTFFGGESYLNHASFLNLTPEIVDKIVQCLALSDRFNKESRFCGWGWALENQVGSSRW